MCVFRLHNDPNLHAGNQHNDNSDLDSDNSDGYDQTAIQVKLYTNMYTFIYYIHGKRTLRYKFFNINYSEKFF